MDHKRTTVGNEWNGKNQRNVVALVNKYMKEKKLSSFNEMCELYSS